MIEVTPTELRKDLFRLLEGVRRGTTVRIRARGGDRFLLSQAEQPAADLAATEHGSDEPFLAPSGRTYPHDPELEALLNEPLTPEETARWERIMANAPPPELQVGLDWRDIVEARKTYGRPEPDPAL